MWKNLGLLLAVIAMPALTAADGSSGCNAPIPSAKQIRLNLPDSLRHCPYAPKNPGDAATNRQTRVYMIGLYHAWSVCHSNNETTNTLYEAYQKALNTH